MHFERRAALAAAAALLAAAALFPARAEAARITVSGERAEGAYTAYRILDGVESSEGGRAAWAVGEDSPWRGAVERYAALQDSGMELEPAPGNESVDYVEIERPPFDPERFAAAMRGDVPAGDSGERIEHGTSADLPTGCYLVVSDRQDVPDAVVMLDGAGETVDLAGGELLGFRLEDVPGTAAPGLPCSFEASASMPSEAPAGSTATVEVELPAGWQVEEDAVKVTGKDPAARVSAVSTSRSSDSATDNVVAARVETTRAVAAGEKVAVQVEAVPSADAARDPQQVSAKFSMDRGGLTAHAEDQVLVSAQEQAEADSGWMGSFRESLTTVAAAVGVTALAAVVWTVWARPHDHERRGHH